MNTILPEEAEKIINNSKAKVIDVRTPEEFADGHIPGAININIYNDTFMEEIKALPADALYVINCQSGGRSAKACGIFEELGFVGAMNLDGGFGAWKKAGMPVEKR